MTRRFCGLTLLAVELLLMQGTRLHIIGQPRRSTSRRHREAEGDPETFLHEITELLPLRAARTPKGREATGAVSCRGQIAEALLLTQREAIAHLGNGATFFWCELAVYVERPGLIPQLPSLNPVLLGRLIVAHSEDRRQWAAELMSEGLLDPYTSTRELEAMKPRTGAKAALRPAETLVEEGSITRRGALPAGADSHAMLSLPDEPLAAFSASVCYSLVDRYLMPRVYRGTAGLGRHSAVPAFSVACTSVSDPFARAIMVASMAVR